MYGQSPESSAQEHIAAAAPVPAPRQHLLNATLVAGVVLVACVLGILTRPDHQLAAFWPANALLLGLLVRRPALASPVGWAAAALGFIAADLLTGNSLPTTLRLTAANLAGVIAGWLAFRQIRREDRLLQRPLSMLWVLLASAVAAAAATLVGSVTAHLLVHMNLAKAVGIWFSAELVSYVAILPAVLLAPSPRALAREFQQYLLQVRRVPGMWLPLVGLAIAMLLGVVIGGPGAIAFPVPALLWCALAYRLFTTALVTLLLCVWTLIAIANGIIDLGLQGDSALPVISLRIGMALLVVAPLTVAGVNAARNHLLAALNHAADHDSLTGALTRSAFLRRGRRLLQDVATEQAPAVAMMLDIDHFKSVNDRHGHAAGDAVLVAFVQRARGLLREEDMLGRLGGEEFAVLMPAKGLHDATQVAEHLRSHASHLLALEDGRVLDITVSVGVTLQHPHEDDLPLEVMLKHADDALYRAKAMGRNRVVMDPRLKG